MTKIAIFCVCYNSYEILEKYLSSIDHSSKMAEGIAEVEVFVSDNTPKNVQPIKYDAQNFQLKVYAHNKNLGYFGGIGLMMQQENCHTYDYCIVSNVDVLMQPDTIKSIALFSQPEKTGWIAPIIFSEKEQRDRNPQARQRYSRKRLSILRFMYKFSVLHYLYHRFVYKHRHNQTPTYGEVYAGHGSFIILTKEYIKQCGIINYPIFLYGEEIYLAEQCRKNSLKVIHTPEIQVYDFDHYSTSGMKRKFYYQCHYEAIDYAIKNFFNK